MRYVADIRTWRNDKCSFSTLFQKKYKLYLQILCAYSAQIVALNQMEKETKRMLSKIIKIIFDIHSNHYQS